MAEEFTPITTQEEFDAKIKDRLAREKAKYADYETIKSELATLKGEKTTLSQTIETLRGENATIQTQLEEANTKVKGYEVDKLRRDAAKAAKLDESLAERLKGDTAEELQADAEELAKALKKGRRGVPTFRAEPDDDGPGSGDNERKASLKGMLEELIPKEN